MNQPVLDVQNLTVRVLKAGESIALVNKVSFSVSAGQCLGILGESGSGKSMTWKSIMKMTEWSGCSFVTSGQALFKGRDLLRLSQQEMKVIRGRRICMILQNPMNCFDPLCRIGAQIEESWFEGTLEENRRKSIAMLDSMQVSNPEDVLEKYPHQLSGGMLQRIMIGIALVANPDLIIADEPTTAIDSLTQFEILQEFKKIKKQHHTALIFISHDIGCVSMLADRILVMRDGQVRQYGEAQDVLMRPDDEYTQFLIQTKRCAMDRFRIVMNGDFREASL